MEDNLQPVLPRPEEPKQLEHRARASHHLSEAAVILTMTSPFEGRPAGSMPLGGQPNFSVVEQPRRFTGGLPVEKYFRDQLAGR